MGRSTWQGERITCAKKCKLGPNKSWQIMMILMRKENTCAPHPCCCLPETASCCACTYSMTMGTALKLEPLQRAQSTPLCGKYLMGIHKTRTHSLIATHAGFCTRFVLAFPPLCSVCLFKAASLETLPFEFCLERSHCFWRILGGISSHHNTSVFFFQGAWKKSYGNNLLDVIYIDSTPLLEKYQAQEYSDVPGAMNCVALLNLQSHHHRHLQTCGF